MSRARRLISCMLCFFFFYLLIMIVSGQYEGKNLSIKMLSRTTVKRFLYHLVGCCSLYNGHLLFLFCRWILKVFVTIKITDKMVRITYKIQSVFRLLSDFSDIYLLVVILFSAGSNVRCLLWLRRRMFPRAYIFSHKDGPSEHLSQHILPHTVSQQQRIEAHLNVTK